MVMLIFAMDFDRYTKNQLDLAVVPYKYLNLWISTWTHQQWPPSCFHPST